MMYLRTGIPQAGRRWLRGLAIGAGAVLLTAATLNANDDGAVVSLSVVPTSGRAQVVIGVDGNVSVKDFTLRSPERIVVDITGATLSLRQRSYDRVARGGVIDVRTNQFKPNVVRVVLSLSGPRHYQVVRGKGAVMISVDGGGDFVAWRASGSQAVASASVATPLVAKPVTAEPDVVASPRASVSVASVTSSPMSLADYIPQAPQGERRISVVFDKASIVDVLAQFAAFSHRTIIPAKSVASAADITAEIKDKPWDVAMKVILNANGYDAVEDPNGIIIVNTLEALAARPRLEALTTQTVRFNYTSALAVADAIKGRLTRDCGQQAPGPTGAAPAGGAQAPTSALNCPVRGAVTADSLTNSVSITDAPTAIEDIIRYAKTLDVRQPQVNIKAKIITVDRTQLDALGLKYDLGSQATHFNGVLQRNDSLGQKETVPAVVQLGGNAMAAIANATSVGSTGALDLVYSAAVGAFSLTSFLDATQSIGLTDVQAEPSVTTLNYRTASLVAGAQIPVRTTEQGAGGNSAGQLPQVTVQLRQTGIVLTVTPFITNNRQIRIRVHAENSGPTILSDGSSAFQNQALDNELLIADGETAVMGGLTETKVLYGKSGIPILVDLPLIGRLFGSTTRTELKSDLLILITPHIVDDGDMTMEPRRQP